MKKILTWLVALAVMAGCATEKPETPPKLYSIAQFMDIVQIMEELFLPMKPSY